ncbi:hypothetical protein BGW36DRAFT_369904 [Talaromyces proteolyticus]|uniref:NAD(P)-binding domain-containing protein n=1 Tax=Talaromyces proteolyticus TaxID=1131652 RepID=A0AAD4L011_9EURO|nr:uncharacterized protein BGW36DRAFT_369904 [Talaromyces proteolyticus]KAH8703739.1 hypothetical protein BGW36DRAFT_369904 [Talaromyces proteolyticus]
MKIILTGSTGYVGKEVLKQCLLHPQLSSIIALSRRELDVTNPKLRVIIHSDFSHYSPEILAEVSSADACIYCLGTNVPVRPAELNRKINFEFALGTANTFSAAFIANKGQEQRTFKFVYLSGALTEKDENKKLWFLNENRKMRGELENALIKLGRDTKKGGFEVYLVRPGFVQPEGASVRNWVAGKLANSIMVHHLAASILRVARDGYREPLIENDKLNSWGKIAVDSVATRKL